VLKFGRPESKGRKMAAKKVDVFVMGTMNLFFFVTGQDRHEIRENVNLCALLNTEEF